MFDPMTLDPGVPLNYDKVRILLHLFKEPDASSGIKLTDKLPQTLGLSPSCNLLSEVRYLHRNGLVNLRKSSKRGTTCLDPDDSDFVFRAFAYSDISFKLPVFLLWKYPDLLSKLETIRRVASPSKRNPAFNLAIQFVTEVLGVDLKLETYPKERYWLTSLKKVPTMVFEGLLEEDSLLELLYRLNSAYPLTLLEYNLNSKLFDCTLTLEEVYRLEQVYGPYIQETDRPFFLAHKFIFTGEYPAGDMPPGRWGEILYNTAALLRGDTAKLDTRGLQKSVSCIEEYNNYEWSWFDVMSNPVFGIYAMVLWAYFMEKDPLTGSNDIKKMGSAFFHLSFGFCCPAEIIMRILKNGASVGERLNLHVYDKGKPFLFFIDSLFGSKFGMEKSPVNYGEEEEAAQMERMVEEGKSPGIALLRYEYLHILGQCDSDEYKALRRTFGPCPPLCFIPYKQKWQYQLQGMLDLLEQEKAKGEGSLFIPHLPLAIEEDPDWAMVNGFDTKIIYILESEGIMQYCRTLLKNGKWSLPRKLSRKAFLACPEYCDKWDRKIIMDDRPSNYYYYHDSNYLPVVKTSLTLRGSGKLFTYHEGELLPLEIVIGVPGMTVTQKDGQYRFDYRDIDYSAPYGDAILEMIRVSATKFEISPRTRIHDSIFQKLRYEGPYPKESLPMIRELLAKADGIMELHGEGFSQDSLIEVDAVPCLTLRLSPTKDKNYYLSMIVYPHPSLSDYFGPGEGERRVYLSATEDGTLRRYAITRNLEAERALAWETIETIGQSVGRNFGKEIRDFIIGPRTVLDLLVMCSERKDSFCVQWPEGQAFTFKGTVSSFRGSLLSGGTNWMELEAGGTLPTGEEVKAAELLLALSDQDKNFGKFVRLDDGSFIALSDALRRQLDKLECVTVVRGGKVGVPEIGTCVLADLLEEGFISGNRRTEKILSSLRESRDLMPEVPATFVGEMRPYQVEGFRWMVRLDSWGSGACLSDDMGLGKTVQAIAFLLYKAHEGPSLVVAPSSVVFNWETELSRFAPSVGVHVLNRSQDRAAMVREAGSGSVVLCSYGILTSESEILSAKQWNAVCLDEAHSIKNRETKVSMAAMSLRTRSRLLLTGTPLQNHLSELWNLFQFMNPGLLGPFDAFKSKYIIPVEVNSDPLRKKQLKKLVTPFILRRTKSQVLDDLPEKTEVTRLVPMTGKEMAYYEMLRKKAEDRLLREHMVTVNILADITKLRQVACSPYLVNKKWPDPSSKLEALLPLVEDIVSSENNVLIFSQFTSFLSMVKDSLDHSGIKYLYLDGSTPLDSRKRLVENFQRGEAPVFVVSLKAGGLGLNLTQANYVILLDPWWNPAIEQQATDRAYRIGQKRNVTVYRLIAQGTIEEKILRLHEKKRELTDSILEGAGSSSALTVDELMEMLQK